MFLTCQFVCLSMHQSFVCYQTRKHDILKMIELSLMPIGISDPRGKALKRSILGFRSSKFEVTRDQI